MDPMRSRPIREQAAALIDDVIAFRAASDRAINSGVVFAETFAETIAEELQLPASYAVTYSGGWILTAADEQVRLTRTALTAQHAVGLATHIEAGWLVDVAEQLAEAARTTDHAADILAEVAADFSTGMDDATTETNPDTA